MAVTLPLFEDFVRPVGGENTEVFSLVPAGVDPREYELTAEDIESLKGVDFFFVNGLGLDDHLITVIEEHRDERAFVLPFSPNVRSPSVSDLTAAEARDEPHLWLDPRAAYTYPALVADEFLIYDGVNTVLYNGNFRPFGEEIRGLVQEISEQLKEIPEQNRKLVTLRGSFEHFARRFDLEVVGVAIDEAGRQPDEARIQQLAEVAREDGAPAVFTEHGYDRSVMDAIGEEAGLPVCVLYSDILDETVSGYLELMRANAAELVRCLGGG